MERLVYEIKSKVEALESEEREWRKELLESLSEEANGSRLDGKKFRKQWIADLRKKFL